MRREKSGNKRENREDNEANEKHKKSNWGVRRRPGPSTGSHLRGELKISEITLEKILEMS